MPTVSRRSFIAGAAAASPLPLSAAGPARAALLVLDGDDPLAASRPVLKALHALQQALTAGGYAVRRAQAVPPGAQTALTIVAGSATYPKIAGLLAAARAPQPSAPESLTLAEAGPNLIVAAGADARGLTYALYELADRQETATPLRFAAPLNEAPAIGVRSVMRQFTSELYDKPWFYDRAMWPKYFAMLAANRFNRIDFTLGLGYDQLTEVADPYLVFAYPFLIEVPGYDVAVTHLVPEERDRNLATLRYISEQAVASGLEFQLGLWMHGYELRNTPNAKYTVTGLTPANHAAYCREALTTLLKALPAVSALGLRIHGESGVPEGSYGFWKAVFAGAAGAGRRIELDLHAKGIDQAMIDNALATGLPVNVAPKFTAEHIGLPYHPADIRPSEIPATGVTGKGLMALSEGQRSFTRYGNADLLREDRKYSLRTRLFYGSQRILASGGAAFAAPYAAAFPFCGMTGFDLMEPLTYRGRRGSAIAGNRRSGYLPEALEPQYDWQKYEQWYRAFGRLGYNPDSDPAAVARRLGSKPQAKALDAALNSASRVLPLVTSIHSASAACDLYWPEVDGSIAMTKEAPADLYFDSPSPKTFQNVTPLDPQLFLACSAYADELLAGRRSGKYSPSEAAHWLETIAAETDKHLAAAGAPVSVDATRLSIDCAVQALLARFYAAKLRAGVLMALFEKTGHSAALSGCQALYREAIGHWQAIIAKTHGVYADDLGLSNRDTEHGQWATKLAGHQADLAAIMALSANPNADSAAGALADAVARRQDGGPRGALAVAHEAPGSFAAGLALPLAVTVRETLSAATLWVRPVNAALRWTAIVMTPTAGANGTVWNASVPASLADGAYPLQYYFELRADAQKTWLAPGFNATQSNQPYVVLRSV